MTCAASCTTTLSAGDDIQAAIDAATAGDVICLSAGTYSPAATLTVNKAITLQNYEDSVLFAMSSELCRGSYEDENI